MFYNDLRNLDNKIDVVADNTTQNASNIASLSSTLAYDYIATSDLNDHLTATYIQQYEKCNFSVSNLDISGAARVNGSNILDLIDDARTEPYVLPEDISLSNLTTNKLTGIGFPEYIYVQGSCNRQLSSLRLFNKRIATELENKLVTAQEPSSSHVTTMCGSVCCNMIATRYSYKVVSTSLSAHANSYIDL